MITDRKTFGFDRLILVAAISVLSIGSVHAQSSTKGYGSQELATLRNRTNASQYTTGRIKQQLSTRSVTQNRFAPRNRPPVRQPARPTASKPFSSISRGPSVSPYLALNDYRSQVTDFYNIVRPQQQQRRINQQQQQTNRQLQLQNQQNLKNLHRLNEMAAAGPFSTKGSEDFVPTGHAAVHQSLGTYLNYGGYFPPPSEPKKR